MLGMHVMAEQLLWMMKKGWVCCPAFWASQPMQQQHRMTQSTNINMSASTKECLQLHCAACVHLADTMQQVHQLMKAAPMADCKSGSSRRLAMITAVCRAFMDHRPNMHVIRKGVYQHITAADRELPELWGQGHWLTFGIAGVAGAR